jgi:hypothetical protein
MELCRYRLFVTASAVSSYSSPLTTNWPRGHFRRWTRRWQPHYSMPSTPDNAANTLRGLKGPRREALPTLLPMEQATVLRGLFSRAEDSAAAHMVRDTLTVRPNMTVSEAVATVREHASGRLQVLGSQ